MSTPFHQGLGRYLTAETQTLLQGTTVGLAGLGGLGSQAAMMLARTGIGAMVLIDKDTVEPSNLNRQMYWPKDVGLTKVEATAAKLLELNPQIRLSKHCTTITPSSLATLLPLSNLWLEALDNASDKAFFVEKALLRGAFVVSASGIAGVGGAPLRVQRTKNLVVVGDYTTDIKTAPPLAPRVTWAAAMLADYMLEHILQNQPRTADARI